MWRCTSWLRERLFEIAHNVLVWCLLHKKGTWQESVGAHSGWEQVALGPLRLSVEYSDVVDCCCAKCSVEP